MIKIENAEVMGWEHAIRGMRNPMDSMELFGRILVITFGAIALLSLIVMAFVDIREYIKEKWGGKR